MSTITKLTRIEFEQSLNAFLAKSYKIAPADQWQLKKDRFVSGVIWFPQLDILAYTMMFSGQPSISHEEANCCVPDIKSSSRGFH